MADVPILIQVRRSVPDRTVTAMPLHVSISLLESSLTSRTPPCGLSCSPSQKLSPKGRKARRGTRTTPRAPSPCSEPPPGVIPHTGMATSHVRNCSDRSPILPCVRRSRKSFAVQSRPIRAHSAAKPSRSANSAPRKFWSYAPAPPLARRAAQRETQTMLYSQCTPR